MKKKGTIPIRFQILNRIFDCVIMLHTQFFNRCGSNTCRYKADRHTDFFHQSISHGRPRRSSTVCTAKQTIFFRLGIFTVLPRFGIRIKSRHRICFCHRLLTTEVTGIGLSACNKHFTHTYFAYARCSKLCSIIWICRFYSQCIPSPAGNIGNRPLISRTIPFCQRTPLFVQSLSICLCKSGFYNRISGIINRNIYLSQIFIVSLINRTFCRNGNLQISLPVNHRREKTNP